MKLLATMASKICRGDSDIIKLTFEAEGLQAEIPIRRADLKELGRQCFNQAGIIDEDLEYVLCRWEAP
jgi:hypothetical protein